MEATTRAGRIIPALIFSFLILMFSASGFEYLRNTIAGNNSFSSEDFIDFRTSESYSEEYYGTNVYLNPVFADLNSDGVKEIVFINTNGQTNLDYWTIDVLDGYSMTPRASASLGGGNISGTCTDGNCQISNLVVHDFDEDGTDEIIMLDAGSERVWYMKYNSSNETTLTNVRHTNFSWTTTYTDNVIIKCNENYPYCLAMGVDYTLAGSGFAVAQFNFTQSTGSLVAVQDAPDNDGFCVSHIHELIYEDLDNDGHFESFIAGLEVDDGSSVHTYFIQFDSDDINSVSYDSDEENLDFDFTDDNSVDCFGDEYTFGISPAFAKDIDGFSSNGKELVVGYANDQSEARFLTWKHSANNLIFYEEYPKDSPLLVPQNFEGRYITNIVSASVFDDDNQDWCAVTYNSDYAEDEDGLICASDINTVPATFWVFDITSDTLYLDFNRLNISTGFPYENILYEVNPTLGFTDTGYSGFLSQTGIHVFANADEEFIELIELPRQNLGFYPIDYDDNNYDDLMLWDDNGFQFIRDSYVNLDCNEYACIRNITITPCLATGSLRQNTTVRIQVLLEDNEDDNIQLEVSFYEGEAYEQNDSFGTNYSSGSARTFTYYAYNRTNNGILEVKAFDVQNPTTIQEINIPFSVDWTGLDVTDLACTYDYAGTGSEEEDEVTPTTTTAEQDIIIGSLEDAQEITGLSSIGLWYLALILTTFIFIWEGIKRNRDIKGLFTGLFVFNLLLIFAGTFFEVLPLSHTIVALVITFLGIGVMVGNYFVRRTAEG